MRFFVYVLVSETTGRRYIGHTDDLARRVVEHNSVEHNVHKYTSKHPGPWRLCYHEEYATRAEAMRREKWLKSGVGRAWLDKLLGRASPPRAD